MTAITRYAPDEVKHIQEKVGQDGIAAYLAIMESDKYYQSLREKSAEELADEAEKISDPDKRDLIFSQAAQKALVNLKPEQAQAIINHIKNRDSYANLIEKIDDAVSFAVAQRGNETEVRKLLLTQEIKEKRISILLELAATLATKGDRDGSERILDEVTKLMVLASPDKDEETRLETRLEIAGKFAAVSLMTTPDKAFSGVEIIIEAVNNEIKRRNSSDRESIEAEEFFYDSMIRQLVLHVSNTNQLMNKMAHTDFKRTLKLLDKFERSEIRAVARLQLIQALLDPEATAKEKEMRERFLDELNET